MNKTEESILIQEPSCPSEEEALMESGLALRNLSHFIKNIVQMVSGGAEVAQAAVQSNNPKYLEKSLNLLLPNLERLKRIIIDLCEYSRVRPPKMESCDWKVLLREVLRDLPPAVEKKLEKTTFQTDAPLPSACLDHEKIRQMIQHFVLFLADQGEDDGCPIQAEVRYFPQTREFLLAFAYKGQLPDCPQSLFEPGEYKGTRFGTGLNLPLARRFVQQHQGRIEVEQRSDGCVVFLVFLPQQPPSSPC